MGITARDKMHVDTEKMSDFKYGYLYLVGHSYLRMAIFEVFSSVADRASLKPSLPISTHGWEVCPLPKVQSFVLESWGLRLYGEQAFKLPIWATALTNHKTTRSTVVVNAMKVPGCKPELVCHFQ